MRSLQEIRTYTETPSTVDWALPANSCDSHVHIFGPQSHFPYANNRSMTPLEAPKEKLFSLHKQLGIERCVIVQSLIHGMDNSAVEDAIKAGQGRYLGVAVVPVTVSDAELERLASAGFRAIRFNFMSHLGNSAQPEQVLALTPKLNELGMHLQVHFESALIHELIPQLEKSEVPVVIDHMGRVNASLGADHADFQALSKALKNKKFHVKISGVDRIDAYASEKNYNDGVKLANRLLTQFPQQCVWGTDWPHPNHTHIPDDGLLVNLLPLIAPTSEHLCALLVDNPQALYRFPV